MVMELYHTVLPIQSIVLLIKGEYGEMRSEASLTSRFRLSTQNVGGCCSCVHQQVFLCVY